jgi:hypothetical protein
MSYEEPDRGVIEPPKFDSLEIKFRGDNYEIVLPYCEVANGDIVKITDNVVDIKINLPEGKTEHVSCNYANFVETVEKAFDIKEITKLSIRRAGSYDSIKIL